MLKLPPTNGTTACDNMSFLQTDLKTMPSNQLTHIRVDVISDTMCPWCLVGKRSLEKAIAQATDVKVEVHWHPFTLHEGLPDEGLPAWKYMEIVYGSADYLEQALGKLKQCGQNLGLNFALNKTTLMAPSYHSHRLVEYAKQFNKESEVVESLFEMYMVRGIRLNNFDELVRVAEEHGLPNAREYLTSGQNGDEVKAKCAKYKNNISGVPYFMIKKANCKKCLIIEGAKPPETFVRAFETIKSASCSQLTKMNKQQAKQASNVCRSANVSGSAAPAAGSATPMDTES